MNKGKALAIFMQINSKDFTNEEKAEAIFHVMNMATHMSVTKDCMLEVIKWLWHQMYEWREDDKQTNHDRIKVLTLEELADLLAENNCCQFCKLDESQTCSNTYCKQGILQYLESEVAEK